jgi:adenylate cyclase
MARLILLTPDGPHSIELRATNTLGRHPNNTIQLLDKIVSKEHCVIEKRDDTWIVRDLGSLNGSYVNGERVQGEKSVKHGDEIIFGTLRPGEGLRARFDNLAGASLAPAPSQPTASKPGVPPISEVTPPTPLASPGSRGAASGRASGTSPQPFSSPVSAPPPATAPANPPPAPAPAAPIGSRTQFLSGSTRVELMEAARAIGAQIQAKTKGFQAFDAVAADQVQLRTDYERLRMAWELTRTISAERDLDKLLEKILDALFRFVAADRAVILLRNEDGELEPHAARRRDGSSDSIPLSTTILGHVIRERASVLTHDAAMDFALSKGKSMILNRISSAIVVPLLHEDTVLGAVWLDSASLGQFGAKDLEIVTTVSAQAALFIQNSLLSRKVEQEIIMRERFSRLIAPNVAAEVEAGRLEIKKGGVRLEQCTVFNSDIRGFTKMSAHVDAATVVDMLNEYFEQMVEIIFRHEGTLDKFMGDGIMAFWGAPKASSDDPVRSVRCGLDQLEAVERFNERRASVGAPPIGIGIGVHTGPLVVGYVGSSKALSYTVIGDTANQSARLCGIAESGQLIVSGGTRKLLGDHFEVEELAPVMLKGIAEPVPIFNVRREKRS